MSHSLPLQDPGRMVFVMDSNLKYYAQNGDPKNGQYKFVFTYVIWLLIWSQHGSVWQNRVSSK